MDAGFYPYIAETMNNQLLLGQLCLHALTVDPIIAQLL